MNLCEYLLACVLLFVAVGGFVGADDMAGADAKDGVELAGADAKDGVNLAGADAKDGVDLAGADAKDGVDLSGADAKDGVDLAGANDKDGVDLARADDKDDVKLAGANDSDDVDLAAADVTDDVDLAGVDETVDQDFDAELTMIYSLQATMDKVLENAGGKKNCSFQCPNGAEPVAKKNHVPVSNGCGSFGVQLDTSRLPGIAKCCDKHDQCYHTCNKDKEHCDDLFKACLINMCKAFGEFVSEEVYDGCKSAADVMYVGTLAVGCAPYLDSQKDACVCPRNRKIDEL